MISLTRTVVATVLAAIVVLSLAAAVAGVAGAASTPASSDGAAWAPGEILVEYRATASARDVSAAVAAADARVAERIATPWAPRRRLVLVVSPGQSVAELSAAFAADPLVLRVSPNYRRTMAAVPNDTSYASQWGLPKIGCETAWNTTTGSSSVVVADLDTGVDYNHEDLAANMWHNPGETAGNGIDDDGNGYVDDVYGIRPVDDLGDPFPSYTFSGTDHGTHVAGIMGGVGNNAKGMAGTAWTTRILAINGFRSDGYIYDSDAIEGINYVIWEKQHGVNVVAVNASWGGAGENASLRSAIQALGSAGIVFCAAAGNAANNNDASPQYPSSYNCGNLISVASSTSTDGISSFSNYGATSVDLAAPGSGIYSTIKGNAYDTWDGTSMATPFVTGSIALLASQYPAESAMQRVSRIVEHTDPLAAFTGKCRSGGRLNVANSLAAAAPPADNDYPGVPAPASPVIAAVGTAGDMVDVYSVPVAAGQTLDISLTGPAGSDFDLYLFPPDTASVYSDSAVASSILFAYPETISYAVPAAGTYCIAVYAFTGSGDYTLTYTVTTTVSDDDIPGAKLPGSPFGGTLANPGDRDDVFAVPLNAGDLIEASITGPGAGEDFDLYLYPPGQTTVNAPGAVAWADDTGNPDSFAYAARVTGTYYLDVWSYTGSGAYTVTCTITPDTTNPTTKAWAPRTAVKRYARGTIKYKLSDTPAVGRVYAQLLVKKAVGGRTVKKVNLGWKAVGTTLKYRLKCSMKKGRYRVYIAGTTRDLAGNPWSNATAVGVLVVK